MTAKYDVSEFSDNNNPDKIGVRSIEGWRSA